MGIYLSKRNKTVEKIKDSVWIKFLAPRELREKLVKYSKSQGKNYAQVLREFIERLPDIETNKKG